MPAHPLLPPSAATPPFLKSAGGKRRLLPHILALLPPGRRLIEPFVGAGAVFVGSHYESYLVADMNQDLVNLYRCLVDDCAGLLARCRQLLIPGNRAKNAYLALRSAFNEQPMGAERAKVDLVYINAHGFNGLCRYNRKGKLNVPWGRSLSAPQLPEAVMARWSAKLAHAPDTLRGFRHCLGPGPGRRRGLFGSPIRPVR